jgi:C4-type Zn-finger protein
MERLSEMTNEDLKKTLLECRKCNGTNFQLETFTGEVEGREEVIYANLTCSSCEEIFTTFLGGLF